MENNLNITNVDQGLYPLIHHSQKRRHCKFALHVALPIVIGGGIYTFWRSPNLLVFSWYKCFRVYGYVLSIRHAFLPARPFIPAWFLYSLPDGCWVYSFTAFMVRVWANEDRRAWSVFWLLTPVSLAVGAELGQGIHIIPGTFDVVDLFVYVVAGALAIFLNRGCNENIH
jgi:hypothetical protein